MDFIFITATAAHSCSFKLCIILNLKVSRERKAAHEFSDTSQKRL